jgi:phosphoribosylformylglycinamidine synthase subunit PurL
VPRGHERAFATLCSERGLPYTPIGVVDGRGKALEVRGLFRIPLDELREAWTGALPTLFEGVAVPKASAEEPAPTPEAAPTQQATADGTGDAGGEPVAAEPEQSRIASELPKRRS